MDGFHAMYNLPKAGQRGMMVHEFCKKEGNCVKYIFQFARITAFCLAGEVLAAVLPLPIPASVYGLAAAGRGAQIRRAQARSGAGDRAVSDRHLPAARSCPRRRASWSWAAS